MKRIKKGFTLVELLVVIAIIAILAAVIAPNAFKAIEKSKVSAAETDYKAIKTASLSYYSDTGKWPANATASSGFVTKPTNAPTGWNGPYMEKWPTRNPWGGSYTFVVGADATTNLGLTTNTKAVKLTSLNTQAVDRLEADLDGTADADAGVVRYSTDKTTVYLIISEQ
ncbi:type II secretion system protein GspG [Haloimpatiens sp. FM7330]|uniref:type II secretion system protein GspG n=1 Tax=Haloimpatiens sp. FM7330 TaxID=3298610 RepID=UPI00363D33C2